VYSAVVNNGPGRSLYWPVMAHYVLKLLQQKPQQCGAIKAVEFISQVLSPLLLVAFETDDNYSIQFEMKNTIRTALVDNRKSLAAVKRIQCKNRRKDSNKLNVRKHVKCVMSRVG